MAGGRAGLFTVALQLEQTSPIRFVNVSVCPEFKCSNNTSLTITNEIFVLEIYAYRTLNKIL